MRIHTTKKNKIRKIHIGTDIWYYKVFSDFWLDILIYPPSSLNIKYIHYKWSYGDDDIDFRKPNAIKAFIEKEVLKLI